MPGDVFGVVVLVTSKVMNHCPPVRVFMQPYYTMPISAPYTFLDLLQRLMGLEVVPTILVITGTCRDVGVVVCFCAPTDRYIGMLHLLANCADMLPTQL